MQITPKVFQFVFRVFQTQSSLFLKEEREEIILQSLTIARVALKCLRRLVISGFQNFINDNNAVEFFNCLVPYLGQFLKISF
jgi:hypothetical protein